MMYPYCKYADETEVVFSHIMKNEEGEEIIHVHFERPTEHGFDSVRFELPSCKILYKDGNYTNEEIELFKTVVERGLPSFYRWAREGGICNGKSIFTRRGKILLLKYILLKIIRQFDCLIIFFYKLLKFNLLYILLIIILIKKC